MKKALLLLSLTTISLLNYNCGLKDDIDNTIDGLQCVELIEKIDEEYDKEDRSCSEIKADVEKILKTCKDYLTDESRAQLEFYAANCDAANN